MSVKKRINRVLPSPANHWVGDGFPVSTVFSPQMGHETFSPFVMLDYAGPANFEPSSKSRGVDSHPHKGFETVTVVYQGELEHRDSAGNSGCIGAGDVQWMTAGAGVLHEEKHSKEFTRTGGTLEMAQLWVNLRAADKAAAPGYQTLSRGDIPVVQIAGGAGTVRVIAGDYSTETSTTHGAATTFSPILVWDLMLRKGASVQLPVPDGFTLSVFVRRGSARVGDSLEARAGELAIFSTDGAGAFLLATEDSELLVLGGEPIREPMATYGPFVMNTEQEIKAAILDYRAGRMGVLVSLV